MPFADLREYVAAVEDLGDLKVIKGADPHLEMGTITELNTEMKGPALLFENILGYSDDFRMLTCPFDVSQRALLAIDLPPDLDMERGLAVYEEKMAGVHPVPPVEVPTGPVYENVFFDDDVDVTKLPAPFWHEHDGGHYLGTGCIVFLRDPDSGNVHFGTYRVMAHDEKTVGLYITPNKTGNVIRKKYWDKGESCPVVVSLGNDPVLFLASSYFLGQHAMSKFDLAGYVRGEPVEVVVDKLTGLPFPATSEVVLVGEVPPPEEETRDEGPFGEWTGYYASGTRPDTVIRVKGLYHRNNPMILGVPPLKGHGITKAHFGFPTHAVNDKQALIRAGVPEVLNVVRMSIPGMIVVQIRQRFPGHVTRAGLAASGEYMGRFVVVVDEDINAWDPMDVLWAIGTRCDPATSITVLQACQSSALDPRIPPDQKERGDYTASQAIIDACKPYSWKSEFPLTNIASKEERARVAEKWAHLFAVQ